MGMRVCTELGELFSVCSAQEKSFFNGLPDDVPVGC
jgi:hypothetical protein